MRVEIIEEPRVSEEEAALYRASARLRDRFKLSPSAKEITARIKHAITPVLYLLCIGDQGTEPWASEAMAGTIEAVRAMPGVATTRQARKLARFIWDDREKRRGRPPAMNEQVVVHFRNVIEAVSGQKFSFSRARGEGRRTGKPQGEMLDALVAALNWANTIPPPEPGINPRKVKAEGVLALLKRVKPQDLCGPI